MGGGAGDETRSMRRRLAEGVLVALVAFAAEKAATGLWDTGTKIVQGSAFAAADYLALAFGLAWMAAVGFVITIVIRSVRRSHTRNVPVQAIDASESVVVCRDEKGSDTPLKEYLRTHKVRTAKMIQFSGAFGGPPLFELLAAGATVEILIQDPKKFDMTTEMGQQQLTKVRHFRDAVRNDLREYALSRKLKIVTYDEPASIRGVKLDDQFICIGWYTYRKILSPKDRTNLVSWLYGHNNATVSGKITTAGGLMLAETFDAQFEALWRTGTPIDLLTAEDAILGLS